MHASEVAERYKEIRKLLQRAQQLLIELNGGRLTATEIKIGQIIVALEPVTVAEFVRRTPKRIEDAR